MPAFTYNRLLRFNKLCTTKVLLGSWQLPRHSRNLLHSMQYKSFNTVFTRTSTGLYLDPSKVSSFYRFVKKDLELKTPSICIIPPWDVQSIYMMSLETRGSEHITTHHILTVWTADNLIHFDIEDEAAYAPRMDVSNDKTTRHHIPDDKCLKIYQHKKMCCNFSVFSWHKKCLWQ